MARVTQPYRQSFSNSIGSGLGSLFGGSGRHYFILEHKMSSRYHRAGESQEIIVDRIEIGRDPRCQVRFDDSFTTVSRRHAAIVRDGDKWKIIQLSETNPTFLNGMTIKKEWHLQNGDEIQLAVGGPKLGFIIPQGNKASVGTIGLSRRFSLFRQQALRPYKTAMTVMGIILLLVIAGAAWWIVTKTDELTKAKKELARVEQGIKDAENAKDSVKILSLENEKKILLSKINNVVKINDDKSKDNNKPDTNVEDKSTAFSDISSCNKHVYAVFLTDLWYEIPDKFLKEGEKRRVDIPINKYIFSGTGFMLSDGRLITARRVIEFWMYYKDFDGKTREQYKFYNFCAFNGGKIYAKYAIKTPTGKTYTYTYDQFISNKSNVIVSYEDEYKVYKDGDVAEGEYLGDTRAVFNTSESERHDWAYYQTNATDGGLKCDNPSSEKLAQSTELHILTLPQSMDVDDIYTTGPIYSKATTSGTGLSASGTIPSSNIEIMGRSGGPVLIKKDGEYVVVGLVTKKTSDTKGLIVPISEVRR